VNYAWLMLSIARRVYRPFTGSSFLGPILAAFAVLDADELDPTRLLI
jgi:hypothetical protein